MEANLGKPYQSELEQLSTTYDWAMGAPVEELARTIAAAADEGLIAIGSGGSLSVAVFAANLHNYFASRPGSATTPLDIQRRPNAQADTWHLMISAAGGNQDVLASCRNLVAKDTSHLSIFTGCTDSALARLASRHAWIERHEFDFPVRDGFLATNSLLAFSTLLCRAYAAVFEVSNPLPPSLTKLPAIQQFGRRGMSRLATLAEPLWQRETLVVLHSPSLAAAATDIESKFTEAAIGNTLLSDFRHFGHGRHHWLAKREEKTTVLALTDDNDLVLADRTLALLPQSIPKLTLRVPGCQLSAALGGIVLSIYLAGSAGIARGIDPGRPGVPGFGRRLYRLRTPTKRESSDEPHKFAVRRKILASEKAVFGEEQERFWTEEYRRFRDRLDRTTFRGIVFDYDGTLCDRRDRLTGLQPRVVRYLSALLRAKIPVGFASGRGASLGRDLRKVLPRVAWDRVLVGYYNGTQIALLGDDSAPGKIPCCPELQPALEALQKSVRLKAVIEVIEPRGQQISIQSRASTPPSLLRALVADVVSSQAAKNLRVVWSTHSVDVLAESATKCAVIQALRACFGLNSNDAVMTMGDLGRPPGNDYELLAEPYSLSVDQVSTSPQTCWNLAPAGIRGATAAISYLRALKRRRTAFEFASDRL